MKPTMFPREKTRPTPPPASKALRFFILTHTRAPFLAAVLYKLFFEKVLRIVAKFFNKVFNFNDRMTFGIMLPIVHSFTYTLTFCGFEFIERNRIFEKYRIERIPGQEPTWSMKWTAFLETARGWPGMFIGGQIFYHILQKRGSPSILSKSPSLFDCTVHLAFSLFAVNITFYTLHRILHHRFFYELIHKKHHEFVGVRSVAAQSLHPAESLIQTVPVLIGGELMATHPLLWLYFLGWRVYTGMEGHSGYSFRGSLLHQLGLTHSDEALYHDCHHLESHRGNFGMFHLDWLFGTQDYWIAIGEEDGYLKLCQKRVEAAAERSRYHSQRKKLIDDFA